MMITGGLPQSFLTGSVTRTTGIEFVSAIFLAASFEEYPEKVGSLVEPYKFFQVSRHTMNLICDGK